MRIAGILRPTFVACLLALVAAPVYLIAQTATPPPWAIPSHTTGQEEIAFDSGDARLVGTLYFPLDEARHSAMIVLHGASSPSSNLPLYRHLTQMLPPLGMAVFVYDRRGSGRSTGNAVSALDFDVLASDAVAAREALATNSHVDSARIGFWGISLGGWLAILTAAKDPQAAFAISVSAPLCTPDVQMNFAVANILRIHGNSAHDIDQALAARTRVDDYLRGKAGRAAAQRALDIVVHKPWFSLIYMSRTLEDPKTSTWLKQMQFDPLPALSKVSAPILMIYGQADPWVPVALSMQRLQSLAANQRNIETAVVDGAGHTMMLGVDPKDQVDPAFFRKEAPNAPQYFAQLAAWLTRHNFASAH